MKIVFANGKCELAGCDVDKYNMRLEIVKIPDLMEYKATIPVFWNSAALSENNPAQPTDKMLMTRFDIYRNENGEEKMVDFVEHYLKALPEEEERTKKVCA